MAHMLMVLSVVGITFQVFDSVLRSYMAYFLLVSWLTLNSPPVPDNDHGDRTGKILTDEFLVIYCSGIGYFSMAKSPSDLTAMYTQAKRRMTARDLTLL